MLLDIKKCSTTILKDFCKLIFLEENLGIEVITFEQIG
jgi:hypothetical protein